MAAELMEPGEGLAGRRVLRSFVVQVVRLPPGPELVAGLLRIMERDLSAREWVEVTVAWRKLASFTAAGELASVAQVDHALAGDPHAPDRPGRDDSTRAAADELAAALRMAPRTASELVGLARRVERTLPAAADALAEGRLDRAQLRVVDQVARDLPGGTRRAVEALAVRLAPTQTPGQLREELEVEAQRLDPDHAVSAGKRGAAERDVALRPSPLAGCKRLVADLPTVPATAAWLALNGAAATAKRIGLKPDGTAETRTTAQLRADLLAALVTGQNGEVTVPTPADLAKLAEVQVVVGLDTLTGAANDPGVVRGVGPVDAATVRQTAVRAPWRRLLADPVTGALAAVDARVLLPSCRPRGLTVEERLRRLVTDPPLPPMLEEGACRYRPGAAMRRHVHTRDGGCVFPAHHHPSARLQLDHTVGFRHVAADARVGTTSADNLGAVCQRGHNAKTHGGWQLDQPTPGTFIWTSPTGRVYPRRARPLLRRPPDDDADDGDDADDD